VPSARGGAARCAARGTARDAARGPGPAAAAVLSRSRAFFTAVFTPLARRLIAADVPPDAVTAVGTIGVVLGALTLFPTGHLFVGVLVVTVFVVSDTLDGVMARLSGRSSTWGAYLDSTLDRFGDAAVFGGLAVWFAAGGHSRPLALLALWCLVFGSITSYAKARAEALGMRADVGIAERADRLVVVLVATGLADFPGLHLPYVLPAALALLAVASPVTVVQRMLAVRRQAVARDAVPAATDDPPPAAAVAPEESPPVEPSDGPGRG